MKLDISGEYNKALIGLKTDNITATPIKYDADNRTVGESTQPFLTDNVRRKFPVDTIKKMMSIKVITLITKDPLI